MKKGWVAGIGLSLAVSASAATVVYEGFGGYADGADLSTLNGGTNWAEAWGTSANDFNASTGSLSYLNLLTTDGSVVKDSGTGFGSGRRNFASTDQSGTIYFSYLFDDNGAANDLDRFSINDTANTSRFGIDGDTSSDQYHLYVDLAGSGTYETTLTSGLDLSQPLFIVAELNITAALDDTFTVWFNPTDLSDVAGTAQQTLVLSEADARAANGGSGQFASINRIDLKSSAGDGVNEYDEIRLSYGAGASIADVTPIPEPATLGLFTVASTVIFLVRRKFLR